MKKNSDSASQRYEVVKYDNSLTALDLSDFRVVENRFLMVLMYKCKDREADEKIVMTKKDFIDLGVYQPGTKVLSVAFKRDLLSTLKKCASLSFHSVSVWNGRVPEKGKFISLFDEIDYDFTDDPVISFSVSPKAAEYLNNLLYEFTRFPLQEFQQLESRYAQALYRALKQFRMTGWWKIRKDDFMTLLNIPVSYKESAIDNRVLKPATEELGKFFKNLTCKKNYTRSGKSRKVVSYEFRWTPDRSEEDDIYHSYPDGSILHDFELEFKRPFNDDEVQRIFQMIQMYGEDTVLRALDEATAYEKISFPYIEKILRTWKEKEDLFRYEKEAEKRFESGYYDYED